MVAMFIHFTRPFVNTHSPRVLFHVEQNTTQGWLSGGVALYGKPIQNAPMPRMNSLSAGDICEAVCRVGEERGGEYKAPPE